MQVGRPFVMEGSDVQSHRRIPDFPRTLDERVYHLGIKAGEVANRVVCYHRSRDILLLTDVHRLPSELLRVLNVSQHF